MATSLVSLEPQMVGGAEDSGGERRSQGACPAPRRLASRPLQPPSPCPWVTAPHPSQASTAGGRGGEGDSGDRRERPAGDMLTWKASLAMARGAGGGAGAAGQALDAPTHPLPLSGCMTWRGHFLRGSASSSVKRGAELDQGSRRTGHTPQVVPKRTLGTHGHASHNRTVMPFPNLLLA